MLPAADQPTAIPEFSSRYRADMRSGLVIVAAAFTTLGAPLHAQAESDWTAPGWVGDVTFLSLNALSGGLTAGLFQQLRGESFTDGFARGALGGSVYYAGLRMTAQRFDGAGLIGRQLAATGTAMVRNASDGRPALERLFVPLGPLHLYIDRADGFAVRPKVNVAALTVLLSAVAEPRLHWDAGATFSAGAPVFRAPGRRVVNDGETRGGYARAGSMFISDMGPEHDPLILAHERVHVVQGDWLFLAWSEPVEAWLMSRIPGGAALYRYVDIAFVVPSVGGTLYDLLHISDANRLYEIEAYFLDSR
jgi:hypothetical protein